MKNGADYNYAIFPPDDDVEAFAGFSSHLKIGETAPDSALVDLDSREPVRLSDYSGRGLTVVEFGSLT